MDDDIRLFEPKIALDGGIDGFSQIREVIKKSSVLIKKKGKLLLEIGFDQVNVTKDLLLDNKFYINEIVKDLSKKNRCIISTKI